MFGRRSLLQTTMLVGLVGASFLGLKSGARADSNVAPRLDGVDGVNSKLGAYGGSLAQHSLYGAKGSITVPLSGPWGYQIDGGLGSWADRGFGHIAGHLFWRNPNTGLVGIYANHTRWDQFGGIGVTQVAAEGEFYWNRFSLQGIAGVEFGNTSTGPATTSTLAAAQVGVAGLTGTFAPVYDIQTQFFDKVNLSYYVTDDWKTFIGHRYLGGHHALALGTEVGLPLGRGVMGSAFVEARLGSDNSQGVWGGLKFYFGQKDKPLILRHRQDDPIDYDPDNLNSIANSLTPNSLLSTKQIPPLQDGDGDGDADGDGDGPA